MFITEAVEFLNKRSQTALRMVTMVVVTRKLPSTILLERDKEYILNKALQIKTSMTISTAASGDFNNDKKRIK